MPIKMRGHNNLNDTISKSVLGVLAITVFFSMFGVVYGDTIQVVTSLGNVFVLDQDTPSNQNGNGTGGNISIDGFGVNARLIFKEHDGSIIYGSGLIGIKESLKPYNIVNSDTRFVSIVSKDDNTKKMSIPEFYTNYSYDNGILKKTSSELPNILGNSGYRVISGNSYVVINDGIIVSGTGRNILQISSLPNKVLLTGSLPPNTTVRLVQSPYNLLSQVDGEHGFLINSVARDIGDNDISVLAGSVDDSNKTGIFSYDQRSLAYVYHGICCTNSYAQYGSEQVSISADLRVATHASGYHEIFGDNTVATPLNISDTFQPGAKLQRLVYNVISNLSHQIYDTLPVKSVYDFDKSFEKIITVPSGRNYLVVDSTGGTVKLKATALTDRNFLYIDKLPSSVTYELVQDGHTLIAGITSAGGKIIHRAFDDDALSGIGGMLHLYDDSITHIRPSVAGNFSRMAFDNVNDAILALPIQDSKVYSTHAYVQIPISSNVTISDIGVQGKYGRLSLDYLMGNYTDNDNLRIPIIPTYDRITVKINDIQVSLRVADVLGGTGLKIADPVSNTVTSSKPDDFINSISATAGAITYTIATSDGNAKAHIQATVFGESEITNTRKYVEVRPPPPPPPPRPTDPLSAWVEVYINGQLQKVDGKTRTPIFFSDEPVEDHKSGVIGVGSYHTAHFMYPAVTIRDTISIPVKQADFVEFYFYSTIHAEGSIPPVPSGYTTHQKKSMASATVTVQYASINTSL